MTETESAAFAAALGVLAETMGETLSLARTEGYFLALRDLELTTVRAAIERAMTTCRFFPRPVELRDLAGAGLPDAGQMHALLIDHLRAPSGDRRSPDDPFLRLLVERLGGIRAAAEMPSGPRAALIAKIVPPLVQAAQARDIPLPTQIPSATAQRLPARAALALPDSGEPRDGAHGDDHAGNTDDHGDAWRVGVDERRTA